MVVSGAVAHILCILTKLFVAKCIFYTSSFKWKGPISTSCSAENHCEKHYQNTALNFEYLIYNFLIV